MKSRIVIALVIVIAAAGAVQAQVAETAFERGVIGVHGQSYVESIDMLFNVRSGGNLSLGTIMGSVNVRTWSREQIRLVVTKRTRAADVEAARRILEDFSVRALHGGRDLTLEGLARTQEAVRAVGVEFSLWVPRSYNLAIKTRSGNVVIPEVDGRFSVHTDAGRIVLDCDTEALDIEVEDRSEPEDAPGPVVPPADKAGNGGVQSEMQPVGTR
jgi:hypothetical protein